MAGATSNNGPLERFLRIFGTVFDGIKTDTERMLDNYDVANVQVELIPYIDALIGWKTNFELPTSKRRRETLNAVSLYKRKGRPDATEAFVENIADWDVTLHEGWRYVFFSNDPRCTTPVPSTLNLALIDTVDDELKYTPTQDNFHGLNGLLIELEPVTSVTEELAGLTLQKIDRLLPDFIPSWSNISNLINMPVSTEVVGVPDEFWSEVINYSEAVVVPLEEDVSVWGAGISLMVSNTVTRTTNTATVRVPHADIGYAGTPPPPAYTP